MRLDFTLNIPTMVSLLTAVIAVVSFGVTSYNNLDRRLMAGEFKIDKLDQRADKTDATLANVREEQSKREATLRAEMKGDLAEIKDLVNRMYYGPSQASNRQPQLNEWRK